MRALVLSDTHFGAWTGRDLLREELFLERLAPALEGIDELIFLGDLFDFRAGPWYFRAFLERRLPGVEVEIAYPTYEFGGVLCTHGHYLDPHARLGGSRGDRLLTRMLWAIAAGGPEEPKRVEDYESVTTLLTEWLYVAAQMPHGTHAQQNVFRAAQRAGRLASALALPVRGAKRLAAELRDRGVGDGAEPLPSEHHFDEVTREEAARQAREQPLAESSSWARPLYPEPTVISRSDPSEHALDLRDGPLLAPGLRPLPALRLARHRGADRRGGAPAVPAGAPR
jgi:hypothetical protein